MKLNNEQQEIFAYFQTGNSFLINAVAGSGKSTMLRYLCNSQYAKGKKILFLAFNKHIADEMVGTVPNNVRVSTSHALGYSLIRSCGLLNSSSLSINSQSVRRLYNYLISCKVLSRNTNYATFEELWQLVRSVCPIWEKTEDTQYAQILKYFSDYKENMGDLSWFFKAKAYKDTVRNSIDFTDMLWLPNIWEFSHTLNYDIIMIDELQDLNNAQIGLINKLKTENTQIIGVGDPMQSIFSFSGAGANNFPLICNLFNITKILTSSQCYRCPIKHIDLAKIFNPLIRSVIDCPTPQIGIVNFEKTLSLVNIPLNSLIMARKYEQFTPILLEALRLNIPIVVKGVNCFSSIHTKIVSEGLRPALKKLITDTNQIIASTPRFPSNLDKIRELQFKVLIVKELLESSNSEKQVLNFLNGVTGKNKKLAITLSTVHRAKGLEFDNTFILCDKNWRNPETEDDIKINYVAATRSKHSLTFVG